MAILLDFNNLINTTESILFTQERYEDGSKDNISHLGVIDINPSCRLISLKS
jgi:hypothetical protein